MSEDDRGLLVPNQLVGNDQPIEGQSFETKAMECAVKAGAAAVKSSAHVSKKRLARRGAMSGDDPKQIVEFPKAEIVPEERARRLKIEVERLASLPVVERLFYIECEDVAEKHGFSRDVMKAMVEATIKERENKAKQEKAEQAKAEQRAKKQQSTAKREEESKQERKQKEVDKKAEHQQREKKKALATIVKLPSAEHEGRLKILARNSARTSKSCAKNSPSCAAKRKRRSNVARSSRGTSRSTRGSYWTG